MKVLGIVAEYNPFHNGHLYQLHKSKEITESKYCVVVMSGNFVQRGEPAVMNKWARTEAALSEGADLIIELPVLYALSSAEMFAHAAVKILDKTGVVNFLGFGSEVGKIGPLYDIAKILINEPENYKDHLRIYLDRGLSFPDARQQALKDFSPYSDTHLLKSSNNILAVEYLKALLRQNSHMEPFTVKRLGNGYLDRKLAGTFSSATSIREALLKGSIDNVSQCVPKTGFDVLKRESNAGRCPVSMIDFENIIFAKLRQMSPEEISSFMYVNEGLENRIFNAVKVSGNLQALIESISTRRYPQTRIKRILSHILLGIKRVDFCDPDFMEGPPYIRILGFNDKGRELLGVMRRSSLMPVITKPAHIRKTQDAFMRKTFDLESASTDIYTLAYSDPQDRMPNQDYTNNIFIK